MFFLTLISCEEEVKLDLPEGKAKMVVEGHIEQGLPPYLILTKTASFFSNLSVEQYENLFVHNAIITVSDGTNTVQLKEYCSADMNDTMKQALSQYLGVNDLDSSQSVNFCFYSTDPLFPFPMQGETGKRYDLRIQAGDKILTASTAIPYQLTIDSLWYEEHVKQDNDSLVLLWGQYSDPDTFGNYVRYFTRRNNEPFYPGYFGSVFDDKFFNGTTFPFTLARGQSKSQEPNFDNYGYFYKGDTILVKWCAMDAAHYLFWQTAEQEFNNGGNPFGTPTVIQTNINGGLGIWGGYAVYYDTLVVPK